MDLLVDILIRYGYWGMFIASFIAGSFFPFSSEAVIAGLTLAGLDIWSLTICSTIGNGLGGLFNYWVGRMGKEGWIYRGLRIKPQKLARSRSLVKRYGAWMGLLSWLPIIGSVITIAMGLLRINTWKSILTIFLGKAMRYIALALIIQNTLR